MYFRLTAGKQVGCRRICYTDTFESFGSRAPKEGCQASWLLEDHPEREMRAQALHRRKCRELVLQFAHEHQVDARLAVLPGMMHGDAVCGNTAAQMALGALFAASQGRAYVCPIPTDVVLPMIYSTDLIRGLVALQETAQNDLLESAYTLPGLSFSMDQLFEEIRRHYPSFEFQVELDAAKSEMAIQLPNSLAAAEAHRDLSYKPQMTLSQIVGQILAAHAKRTAMISETFSQMDQNDNGTLERDELEQRLLRLMGGSARRSMGRCVRTTQLCTELVDKALEEIDTNQDGRISWEEFQTWSSCNTFKGMMDGFLEEKRRGI